MALIYQYFFQKFQKEVQGILADLDEVRTLAIKHRLDVVINPDLAQQSHVYLAKVFETTIKVLQGEYSWGQLPQSHLVDKTPWQVLVWCLKIAAILDTQLEIETSRLRLALSQPFGLRLHTKVS